MDEQTAALMTMAQKMAEAFVRKQDRPSLDLGRTWLNVAESCVHAGANAENAATEADRFVDLFVERAERLALRGELLAAKLAEQAKCPLEPAPPGDAVRAQVAAEIVEAQKLTTLEEAKRFAQAWIESAAQGQADAGYWRKQAEQLGAK